MWLYSDAPQEAEGWAERALGKNCFHFQWATLPRAAIAEFQMNRG